MTSKTASIEIQVRIGNTWESPGCSRKEATIEAPTLIEAHTQALAAWHERLAKKHADREAREAENDKVRMENARCGL